MPYRVSPIENVLVLATSALSITRNTSCLITIVKKARSPCLVWGIDFPLTQWESQSTTGLNSITVGIGFNSCLIVSIRG